VSYPAVAPGELRPEAARVYTAGLPATALAVARERPASRSIPRPGRGPGKS